MILFGPEEDAFYKNMKDAVPQERLAAYSSDQSQARWTTMFNGSRTVPVCAFLSMGMYPQLEISCTILRPPAARGLGKNKLW